VLEKFTVKVSGAASNYDVVIGAGVISKLPELVELNRYSSVAIVFDEAIERLWLPKLRAGISQDLHTFPVKSGEHSKDVDSLKLLWNGFAHARLDRSCVVINLGGGMVCDLGGFAASTYLRGVDFIHVPTTLLSQVDASIGGKTAVNVVGAKNIAGTFAAPASVIMDVQTLSTLPERELKSGFAEIIKHGLIADSSLLEVLKNFSLSTLDDAQLIELVARSCRIKQLVVESDFRESGLRQTLNFGHTLGHAIEGASHLTKTPLLHGEAIGIGMVGEAYLSMKLGNIDAQTLKDIERLLTSFGLPTRIPSQVDVAEIGKLLTLDKKRTKTELRWVMLAKIGQAIFDVTIPVQLVAEAINYLIVPQST
jgi:3-dehydroquinate synthase